MEKKIPSPKAKLKKNYKKKTKKKQTHKKKRKFLSINNDIFQKQISYPFGNKFKNMNKLFLFLNV